MSESSEAFGDVARRRSGGVLALIAVFEVANDVRLGSNCEDQTAKFISKLPGNQIRELFGHGAIADAIGGPSVFEALACSVDEGCGLNLDQEISARQERDADPRTGRWVVREGKSESRADDAEILSSTFNDVDPERHHIVDRAACGFNRHFDIVQGLASLLRESRANDLLVGVPRRLTGNKDDLRASGNSYLRKPVVDASKQC